MTVSRNCPIVHHPCLEPQAQQFEHPPIRDPLGHQRQQLLLVDRAEIVPDVGLRDPHRVRVGTRPGCAQAPAAPTAWAKTVGDLQKVGLEDRLQHQPRRLLTDPVADRRDAQRPHTTIWLADRHAPHRRRTIRALTKSTLSSPSIRSTPYSSTSASVTNRRRPRPGSYAPASTPPTGRHSDRSGHTERENGDPGTAWHMPIACAEVLAHPHQWPQLHHFAGRDDGREPAGVVGSDNADHALTLTSTARMIKAGALRSRRVLLHADPTTTTPSDSRCPPLDFAIGLYERSLLTRLGRRVSLVPRSDLARVQVSIPRRDPPHPIRNQDWRTWPSP